MEKLILYAIWDFEKSLACASALPWGPINSLLCRLFYWTKMELGFWTGNPPFLNLFFKPDFYKISYRNFLCFLVTRVILHRLIFKKSHFSGLLACWIHVTRVGRSPSWRGKPCRLYFVMFQSYISIKKVTNDIAQSKIFIYRLMCAINGYNRFFCC